MEWIYQAVQGITNSRYEVQQSQPDDWAENYGNYYTVATKQKKEKKQIIYNKGDYITVQTAIDAKMIKVKKSLGYPLWESNKFYVQKTWTTPPEFPSGGVWYTTYKDVPPAWADHRYFKREVDKTPKFKLPDPANDFYGYWELHKNEEQIPDFVPNTYHYETIDRMKVLVNDALTKLADLRDTSTLNIDLELESQYDVGDIVGSIDEVTGIKVNKMILRKTIKIKKDIVTVSHEVE